MRVNVVNASLLGPGRGFLTLMLKVDNVAQRVFPRMLLSPPVSLLGTLRIDTGGERQVLNSKSNQA